MIFFCVVFSCPARDASAGDAGDAPAGDGGCWGAGTPEVLAAAVLHGCGLFCLILTGDLGFVWQDENFEGWSGGPFERLSDVPRSAAARGQQRQQQQQQPSPRLGSGNPRLGNSGNSGNSSNSNPRLGSDQATLGSETAATAATAAALARTRDGGSWSRGRPFLFLEETHVFCLAQDEMWGPWGPDAGGRWGGDSIFCLLVDRLGRRGVGPVA